MFNKKKRQKALAKEYIYLLNIIKTSAEELSNNTWDQENVSRIIETVKKLKGEK